MITDPKVGVKNRHGYVIGFVHIPLVASLRELRALVSHQVRTVQSSLYMGILKKID